MFIPGATDAAGPGDAGAIFIPGAIVGLGPAVAADGLGAVVMRGMGAIVGVPDGFAAAGIGVVFLDGARVGFGAAFLARAGVAIGIPGMGAIVGSAARTGETVAATKKAATLSRMASKGTSPGSVRVLRVVVAYPQTPVSDLRFHWRCTIRGCQ
jgi:hypothetical protein